MPKVLGEKIVIQLTRKQAVQWGVIHCECGHPPNNHFTHGDRSCAHCECAELRERVSVGQLVEKENA